MERVGRDALVKVRRNERRTLRRASDSPRRRSPSEKRVPVYVWVKSPLTFDQWHLSRSHYGDTPPPAGATTSPGSRRGSGRATGLSFLEITGQAGKIGPPSVARRSPGRLTGRGAFSETPETSFAVTSKYYTCILRIRETTRREDDDMGIASRARCLHRELSHVWFATMKDNLIARIFKRTFIPR